LAWNLLDLSRTHRREPLMLSLAIRIFDVTVVALIFTALT
jgi:hypothetical protein